MPYGLAGYVFTKSARRSAMLADQLQTGMVAVNGLTVSTPETPVGGVKDSGYGREGGAEGILEYSNIKFRSEVLV